MTVEHAKLRCTCKECIAERRAEVDARRDEAASRKEELSGRQSAFFEATPSLRSARRRPMPGTLAAIARRYGGAS